MDKPTYNPYLDGTQSGSAYDPKLGPT